MRYGGSEAYAFESVAVQQEWRESPLVPVEGGRLDAKARSGISADVVRAITRIAMLAISLFVAGSMSIALTSGTVGMLQTNANLSSQIKETRIANDDLRIECSLLSSAERISRIATQNLGMVYASKVEVIELG